MELSNQIKQILFEDWDPIGVGEFPEANDEYDLYIPQVRDLILKRASPDEISRYLSWIEKERMGFSEPHTQKISNATKKLCQLMPGSN